MKIFVYLVRYNCNYPIHKFTKEWTYVEMQEKFICKKIKIKRNSIFINNELVEYIYNYWVPHF